MTLLVATESEVLMLDAERPSLRPTAGLGDQRPTCLAAAPRVAGRAWCGTHRGGVFRSDDGGETWRPVGLQDLRITAITADPVQDDAVWVGTEPSEVWHSGDGGSTWERTRDLEELPSSPEWSFPPKPQTHHVRWIAADPHRAGRLWVAIEAGALVSTTDGGRSWRDRVPGGPWDTHELAIHPDRPEVLRVAAGDGYFESPDGGDTWATPRAGLDVGYLRSVAIDPGRPDVVVVSAASHAHAAYVAGASDGRLYRREGAGRWERVVDGWPDPPDTIAPLVRAGSAAGELWAADERGIHRSDDGGATWRRVAAYATTPHHLRGLALVGRPER
ncbi:MAG TPA: YCF48-related protein [Longimicrobiales bacterium]